MLPSCVLDPLVRRHAGCNSSAITFASGKTIGLAGTDEAEVERNRMELGITVA